MNKFHAAKVRRFRGYHNRLFMAFVIPHSWYFVVREDNGYGYGYSCNHVTFFLDNRAGRFYKYLVINTLYTITSVSYASAGIWLQL